MNQLRTVFNGVLIWISLLVVVAVAIGAAAMSPLLAWRDPVYITAGFAGVIAMSLMAFQAMLAAGYLPGLAGLRGRRAHRWVGSVLVLSVIIHVAGLWITSPPDVIDALLFVSPTPFSVWGVIAMWALFATACLAALRLRLRLRPITWRLIHGALAVVIVSGSVVHAMMIDGTMESLSKLLLCAVVVVATVVVLAGLQLRK